MTATNTYIPLLETLNNDLEALGWDQPDNYYFILGSEEDPYLARVAESESHPCDTLKDFHTKVEIPDSVLGLVIATETVRSLSLRELTEDRPDLIPSMKAAIEEKAQAVGQPLTFSDDEFYEAMIKSYNLLMQLIPPSHLPPPLQREDRLIVAVTKEGIAASVVATRGGEVVLNEVKNGRIYEYAMKYLNGEDPATAGEVSGEIERVSLFEEDK